MRKEIGKIGVLLCLLAFVPVSVLNTACSTTTATTGVSNKPGNASAQYVDPSAHSGLNTNKIESADIKAASQKMVGDMLNVPVLVRAAQPPHIVVDAKYFSVQSAVRINKNIFTDMLRSELMNAANRLGGKLIFVSYESAGMVMENREMMEEGLVGSGTTSAATTMLGADYRLRGRITDDTTYASGRSERYTLMNYEIVDIKTGQVVFTGIYDFKKAQTLGKGYR